MTGGITRSSSLNFRAVTFDKNPDLWYVLQSCTTYGCPSFAMFEDGKTGAVKCYAHRTDMKTSLIKFEDWKLQKGRENHLFRLDEISVKFDRMEQIFDKFYAYLQNFSSDIQKLSEVVPDFPVNNNISVEGKQTITYHGSG